MRDVDVEHELGLRRLLRAGIVLAGTAGVLWLLVLGLVAAFADSSAADPIRAVLIMTFTIALWPFAIIGLLLLLCWFVLRIAAR